MEVTWFFRIKKSGHRAYVQVVENKRFDGAVRQSVIANLGRADDLIASGALASLLASGAKFTDQVLLITTLDEDRDGSLSVAYFFTDLKPCLTECQRWASGPSRSKKGCSVPNKVSERPLVPKLHLGTQMSPQLRCFGLGEAKLRRQVRSQVQLGNEEAGSGRVLSLQKRDRHLKSLHFPPTSRTMELSAYGIGSYCLSPA